MPLKIRRVLRTAAVAALLKGFGRIGCLGAGSGQGGDEHEESEDDGDTDRRLTDEPASCLNGVVEILLSVGRNRRPLALAPPANGPPGGVPITSALRDLEPV